MLFIITPMREHVQNGSTIARYWTSSKLNYGEIEFVPRAQESWAGLSFTLCLLPSQDWWEQVSNGMSTTRSGNWAIAPRLLLSLSKTGQPSFPWGTGTFCWWESSPSRQTLQVLSLNQEKASGRLGYPFFSLQFSSQRLELAQKCLKENSIFLEKCCWKKGGIEENPRIFSSEEGNEKEMQQIYKHRKLIFHAANVYHLF